MFAVSKGEYSKCKAESSSLQNSDTDPQLRHHGAVGRYRASSLMNTLSHTYQGETHSGPQINTPLNAHPFS